MSRTEARPADTRRILLLLRPWTRWVVYDFVAVVFLWFCRGIVPPLALKFVIDDVIPQRDMQALVLVVTGLFAAGALFVIVMVVDEYFCHFVANNVMVRRRLDLFEHLQRLSFSYFSFNKSGEILAKVHDDTRTIYTFLAWNGSTLMGATCGLALGLGFLVWIDWRIAGASLVLGYVFYHGSDWASRNVREASAAAKREGALALERMRESIAGMSLCRILGTGDREVEVADSQLRLFREARILQAKQEIKSALVVGGLTASVLAVVYGSSVWLIGAGSMTLGGAFMAAALATTNAEQVGRILRLLVGTKATGPALDRGDDHLATPSGVSETTGNDFSESPETLSFDEVMFGYPRTNGPVLNGFSLTVERGEKVAIVGKSGCGKSTLVELLLRFYEPDAGRICFNGIDISTIPGPRLRQRIAVVSQDVQIRTGSLQDNVRIGKPGISNLEVQDALERSGLGGLAGIHGLETEVGERGRKLSGGQQQRLSLARALVRRAPILVLDEASSALDALTEQAMNAALLAADDAVMTIIISHRLSTVLMADRIVVMDEGRVAETGTHKELIARGGIYTRLFEREERGLAP